MKIGETDLQLVVDIVAANVVVALGGSLFRAAKLVVVKSYLEPAAFWLGRAILRPVQKISGKKNE
jgi:hypothetical protein